MNQYLPKDDEIVVRHRRAYPIATQPSARSMKRLGTRVLGSRHLKLRLRAPSGEVVDAIAFRHLDDPAAPALHAQDTIDLVYRTALDEYGGARRLQLVSEWLAPVHG